VIPPACKQRDTVAVVALPSGSRRVLTILTLAILMLLTAASRFVLTSRYYLLPDADQSVLGLMARHVLLGERPVFYWGQVYTGSGEAYLTGLVFRLAGQSDTALHVVPLCSSVAFCLLTALQARRWYGDGIALLTAVLLAGGPAFLVLWSGWAGSGYLEAMLLGTAALLLGLPGGTAQPRRRSLLLAFALLGLAIWTQPIAVYYLLALLAGMGQRLLPMPARPDRLLLAVGCVLAFCAGALPLLVFNLQHQAATVTFLTARSTHLPAITVLSRLLLWAGPVCLGFLPPSSDRASFLRYVDSHYALYALALILLLLMLFRGLSQWRALPRLCSSLADRGRAGDRALLALGLLTVGGYVLTGWGGEEWAGTQPRYLLPAYSVLPLVLRVAMLRRPAWWRWLAACGLICAVVAVNLTVLTESVPRQDLVPLATVLEQHGVGAVYGDYWTVYPLMFESAERLVGVAVNDDLGRGLLNNRYSPYLRAAAHIPDFAWVAATGSARDRSIRRCLARLQSRYTVITWQDQTLYMRPTGRAFPWWNGGRC
jgi:hypothetical protein